MKESLRPIRIAYASSVSFIVLLVVVTLAYQFLGVFIDLLALATTAFLGLTVVSIASFAIYKHRSRVSLGPLLLVLVTCIVWYFLPTNLIVAYVRAAVESTAYERAVEELKAGATPSCAIDYRCRIDEGPPRRIAFVWSGLVDNWVGVVYDPETVVTDATRYEKLFGGDMLYCEHLWGHYYFCGFT